MQRFYCEIIHRKKDQEKEHTDLSNHIDNFGWIKRTYIHGELICGEITIPKILIIKIFYDCVETKQSYSSELQPFNLDSGIEIITSTYDEFISSSVMINSLKELLLKQETMDEIITVGHVSRISSEPHIYYRIFIGYQ